MFIQDNVIMIYKRALIYRMSLITKDTICSTVDTKGTKTKCFTDMTILDFQSKVVILSISFCWFCACYPYLKIEAIWQYFWQYFRSNRQASTAQQCGRVQQRNVGHFDNRPSASVAILNWPGFRNTAWFAQMQSPIGNRAYIQLPI